MVFRFVVLSLLIAFVGEVTASSASTPFAGAAKTIARVNEVSRSAVMIHPSDIRSAIHPLILGMNEFVVAPLTPLASMYEEVGIRGGRFPGGSISDRYDWATNALCKGSGKIPEGLSFDDYMTNVAIPARLDVEVTVNYGTTNAPVCDSPGLPVDAAAWVKYSNKTKHYAIKWWEIGNEVWGSWEKDSHSLLHDAATYSSETALYASKMKAEDPTILIGVPLAGYTKMDTSGNEWDAYILSHATYDYVAYHSYYSGPGKENDEVLLLNGPGRFRGAIDKIRSQLATAGKSNTPISVSEWNSVYSTPGKQTVSIVNGLYAGEIIGEMLNLGIQRAEFWNTFGCEYGGRGNNSSTLYGWQKYGSLGAFSEGVPFPTAASGCHWDHDETVPSGTPFPTARAFQLFSTSGFVSDGERMVGVTVPDEYPSVRAYAASHGKSYGLMLFNLSGDESVTLPVIVEGHPELSRYKSLRYGKAEYDMTRDNGPWIAPIQGSGRAADSKFNVTLPPWSMTAYSLSP